MLNLCRKLMRSVGILVAPLLVAMPVWADEQNVITLEGITVSAQKREENVQEVPLSVGVVTETQLEDTRTGDLTELGRNSPNLFIATAGGAGTFTYLGIRGRINSDAHVDPNVTVIVDGVPYDDFYSMGNNLLFDVERVEVLRGSQSTLYGLNSSSGVINVVSKEPGDEFRARAYAEGSYGSSWDGTWRAGAAMSGPIVADTLSGGLAVATKGQGGYIENLYTDNRSNSDNMLSTRGSLVWTPFENWKVSAGLIYSDLSADAGFLRLPSDDDAAQALGWDRREEWERNNDWEGSTDTETIAPNLKVNYHNEDIDVISITAYRHSDQYSDFDLDNTPFNAGYMFFDNSFDSFSQELRVQSGDEPDASFNWMVGYFFHSFEQDLSQGIFDTSANAKFNIRESDYDGHSNALFGQATYRVLDNKLGFTVGVRQEWTEREMQSPLGLYEDNSKSDSQFLPKFAVDYRYSPEAMFYASVTQGWRSGGVNPYRTGNTELTYEKETSWTYEVGVKTQWFDNRFMFNLSAFFTDYNDYLDLNWRNRTDAWLGNVPEVHTMGFEAEFDAQLTDSLQLTGFLGYVHAEYKDYRDEFEGNTVISFPDFTANIALNYTFLDHFYIRPWIQSIGTIYWDRANTKKENPYMTVNFKAGYVKNNYEIYIYGENLTDEYAIVSAAEDFGQYTGIPNTSCQFGIGASIRF